MNVSRTLSLIVLLFGVSQSAFSEEDGKESEEAPTSNIGRMGDPVRVDPEEFEFSQAEKKLWLSNHLKNIDKPGRLYYTFEKSGTYEKGFTDAVYLDILEINENGTKDTDLEFFTGNRRRPATARNLVGITGNPILGLYMQGDALEMNRLTDGSWRYFQRRIKMAFSNSAKVEEITIDYNGDKIDAEKITIKPYLNDPRRRQFEEFAGKTYEFILSRQIPGSIYQIKTVIPNVSDPDDDPLIAEKLTFQEADFKS